MNDGRWIRGWIRGEWISTLRPKRLSEVPSSFIILRPSKASSKMSSKTKLLLDYLTAWGLCVNSVALLYQENFFQSFYIATFTTRLKSHLCDVIYKFSPSRFQDILAQDTSFHLCERFSRRIWEIDLSNLNVIVDWSSALRSLSQTRLPVQLALMPKSLALRTQFTNCSLHWFASL